MLVHNVLTGDQLGMEALNREAKIQEKEQPYDINQRNRIGVYQSEQALLDVVRRGDINYHQVLNRSSSLSPGVPVHGRDPLRQMKTSIVVFTTLVTRAAMEGGLSPEIAYPLGDSYIQTAEDCRDSGELNSLAHAMYHDFIYRVHQLRANPHCSHAIQKCCDYIELSLDRKIHAKDLAALVGYTEYYLTEKFKNETGLSVSDYVRNAKINRAKMLLQSTDMSVSEIAERLAFNSANYLIRVFKELEGCTPAAYRERHHLETPLQS
jgi:AraC-like DNA-binding protein